MRTLFLATALLLPNVALAEDADALVKKMDAALNVADDQSLEFEMIDRQAGKDERRLSLEVYLKGEKRLTTFTAPGDIKGTSVLILSPTQMYAYLPAYKKVRRIASHVTEQGFMGTTYSNDDLALTEYSPKYAAELVSEDDASWKLTLTQRPGVEAPYGRIDVTMRKVDHRPTELRYYDDKGKHRKTETREEYTCEGEVCSPRIMKMVDHTDGDHSSSLVRKKWKVNSGLPDSRFSKRSLQRQ